MSRAVPEWIGKTPDTPIPPRVKDRVFDRYEGRCYLSGRTIRRGEPWDAEHIIAIINGGENRESNLAPALKDKHKEKTKIDVAIKSKNYRVRTKSRGQKRPSRLQGRQFERAERQASATRPLTKGVAFSGADRGGVSS
jgi:5-methylcytosine-specific restriction protein A